jgi:hypothetical protein
MAKFRKRLVVIDAFHWTGPWQSAIAPDWLYEALQKNGGIGSIYRDLSGDLNIFTLEGVMRVDNNDWIIKGVKNELYPCKPDIFDATYEAV